MSVESQARSNGSSILDLLNQLNQINSDSLETLERENCHFIISDNLIAAFEEIKSEALFNHYHQKRLLAQHQQEQSTSSNHHQLNQDEERKESKVEDNSSLSTPESGSSSFYHPSSYQKDGIALSDTEDRSSYEETEDVFKEFGAMETSSRTESNNESGLFSLADSISNISDISSCLALYRDGKRFSEMSLPIGVLDDPGSCDNSAESVAIHLLSHFSQRASSSLPRRASCEPLMAMNSNYRGEEVVTNSSTAKLMPVKRSASSCYELFTDTNDETTLVNNYTTNNTVAKTTATIKLRGNSHWAPLRPQLIFNIQKPTDKSLQWLRQNQRCAGCGLQIDSNCKEFNRVLYCYYTGKYFCRQACHSGRKCIIPGHVINKWDFNRYPVSNFAVKFIEKVRSEPLFHINHLNPLLYKRVKHLSKMLDFRTQLRSLKEYILTCKSASNIICYFNFFEPNYFVNNDVHLYSLDDLLSLRGSKKLLEKCCDLVKLSINHVSKCEYCKARGFICELCSRSDLIFPFEIGRTYQCVACKTCYHSYCYKKQPLQECSKCSRIQARRSKSRDNAQSHQPQEPQHQQEQQSQHQQQQQPQPTRVDHENLADEQYFLIKQSSMYYN